MPAPTPSGGTAPKRAVAADGTISTRHLTMPQSEWETLILDHHGGYITWDQYVANQSRLAANRTHTGARPPREGSALCQGIIICGGCGRPMDVHYANRQPHYECNRSRSDHVRTLSCRSVRAATIDEPVAQCLLGALTGEEIGLALAAADEVAGRRETSTRAAELAVERARYQAARAERALLAVEPENRLVARSLEARYESRLRDLADAEAGLAAVRAAKTPLPDRAELQAAVADLDALWAAPSTTDRDRKRLLRTLIADVTILCDDDTAKIRVGVRWHSGANDEILTERVTSICEARRTAPDTVELVRLLGPITDNASLAEELNAGRHRTGTGRRFDGEAVRILRRSYGIPPAELLAPGEATVKDVATRLGVTRSTIIAWITNGLLTARRDRIGRFLIAFGPDSEATCRRHIASSRQIRRHPDSNRQPNPDERTPTQVADSLGISRDAIYNWIAHGYLPARHCPGGHAYINYTPEVQAACRQRIADSSQLPKHVKAQALQQRPGDAL
jgi:predicted DNA-binding transcriptional regulator AlpA